VAVPDDVDRGDPEVRNEKANEEDIGGKIEKGMSLGI